MERSGADRAPTSLARTTFPTDIVHFKGRVKYDSSRRRSLAGRRRSGVEYFVLDRRTKIVATVGPAQDPPGALERLLDAGVDVLRVNLSHASPREQAARVRRARAHRPDIAVLADLGGPKLRLGDLPAEIGRRRATRSCWGQAASPSRDPSLYERVRSGDPVYIADGTMALVAVDVAADRVTCRVRVGGTLRSRKGHQPARRHVVAARAHRQGPGRPGRPRRPGARLRRALLRPPRAATSPRRGR